MNILQIQHLQKDYGKEPRVVHALSDITFSVEGGVFGLLGHNGAGKTTLMKLIATISRPTSGNISVCGFDTQNKGMMCGDSSAIFHRNLICTPL